VALPWRFTELFAGKLFLQKVSSLDRHCEASFMNNLRKYRVVCTLSFGDVYGQIMVWLIVIFISLAAAMALMGAARPVYALATVGLVLVLSLPFLLFSFVTTLLNHIELSQVDPAAQSQPAMSATPASQQSAQAAS
jgi:hypothetical protein